MVDLGPELRTDGDRDVRTRRITRHHSLPGGRAVVGALLVAGAAVAVFAAYLDATRDPSTRYLVAAEPLAPGTVIDDADTARALFSATPLALEDPVAAHAVAEEDLEVLVGRTLAAPLAAGELLQRSALADVGRTPDSHVLSFALPAADAVGGALVPGGTIDVVATYRSGGDASTRYVVRGVPVLDVTSGGGTGASVVLTVALRDVEEVQALGHAVHTATVLVVSRIAPDDGPDQLPAPYPAPVPDPTDEGSADG